MSENDAAGFDSGDEIRILRDQLRVFAEFGMYEGREAAEIKSRIGEMVIENSIPPDIFEKIMLEPKSI